MDELWAAIKKGDRATVERVVGADPSLAGASDEGVSAVMLATYWRKPEIARWLAERKGDLTIFEATALGDVARVMAELDRDPSLANAFSPDGFQALGLAAFFAQPEIAELLLARGADPSTPSRNDMKVTPLHSAVASGQSRIAKALVHAGAELNVKQRHGWTPLHGAAEHGDRDLVELLLDRGADPLAATDDGMTAAAFARSRGFEEIARAIDARVRH
ncbi:MAG TPA: ankyrin repeat domain-containing protein [Candidatus Limnocylindria bacterium]|nr:ankyrin repeat domain-containing protein [Candidatus Limnocylindria bacterium]